MATDKKDPKSNYIVGGYEFMSEIDAQKADMDLSKIKLLQARAKVSRPSDIKAVYEKAIENKIFKTPIGWNYLSGLREKLLEAESNGNTTDLFTLSYIFASEHIPLSNVEAWELSEYKSSVFGNGYSFSGGELMHGFAYYCAMAGGMVPKWIRHIVSQIRDDLPRLFSAVKMLADSEGLNSLANDLRIASISAIRKVPTEVARTIDEFGLKQRSSALELHDMGIDTKDDLKKREDDVIEYGSEGLIRELQENGFLKDADHRRLMNG